MNEAAQVALPYSIEAEQQALGAILGNNALFDQVSDILTPDRFYDPVHADIFKSIADRVSAGQIASPVTLAPEYRDHEGMKELGGLQYLVRMVAASISSFAIRNYAQSIVDTYLRRELLRDVQSATVELASGKGSAPEIAFRLESAVGRVTSTNAAKPLIRSHLSAIMGAVKQINEAYQGGSSVGVSTGIPQLDAKIQKLRPGQLIILAGRPGMGKTTVAQSIAFHVAAIEGLGVCFESLEMTGEELGVRFISRGLAERKIYIPYNAMIGGRLSEPQMRDIVEEGKRQQDLPMIIGERDVRELNRLRASVRRAKQQLEGAGKPLSLVVVDYVQRISCDTSKSFHERIARATDMLKTIAMEFAVPVVALAQLNRDVERREPPIPMLSDLKESGSLEEDADVVIFCYREAYYMQRAFDAMDPGDPKRIEMKADLEAAAKDIDLIVAKQRSGPTGTVKAFADMAYSIITADRSAEDARLI